MAHQYQIAAGEFKAKCLKLMDNVQNQHVEYVITKRGKPMAKLVPVEEKPPAVFGSLKGTVTIKGDIVASIDETWDVDK